MKKEYVKLVNTKQEFLFSGPQNVTKNIVNSLNDPVLSDVNFNDIDKLNNNAQFNINLLVNKDGKHILFQIAFVYGYSQKYDESEKENQVIIGKYNSLIELYEPMKDPEIFNNFVQNNILILAKPSMNYISKIISNITSETLDYPNVIDMYSKFKKKFESNEFSLTKAKTKKTPE